MAYQVREGQSLIVRETGTYHAAGEKVDLSHLSEAELDKLTRRGVVEAVPGPAPKPAKAKEE